RAPACHARRAAQVAQRRPCAISPAMRLLPILLVTLLAALHPAARLQAEPSYPLTWPDPEQVLPLEPEAVTFPSSSPFSPVDIGDAPETPSVASLYLPPGASAEEPAPAVIMLHGAGGVIENREHRYGRELASLGIAALVVD